MPGLWIVLVGFMGASLGSFANVVAHRLPLDLSIVRPASRCPSCRTPVPIWANVPVLGWLFVRGRCHHCRVPISMRYPLVELAAGLLSIASWLALAGREGPTQAQLGAVLVPWFLQTIFVVALLTLTLIDLDWFLLPNEITLPLALLGLVASLATTRGPSLQAAALGAALGALVPYLGMRLYGAITGREGLGGGDWKLLMAIGAWLGAIALPFVVFAGALQGLLAAALFRRDFARASLPPLPGEAPVTQVEDVSFAKLAVPFGPFLALAALEWLYFRGEIAAVWPLARL